MSIGTISSPSTWVQGTIATASWFQQVQDNINGFLAGTDSFKAIVIDGIGGQTVAPSPGTLTVSNGATVTAGGLTVTAGGLTVTAGGATITAGGLTVSAGGASITGTLTANSAFSAASTSTFTGLATFNGSSGSPAIGISVTNDAQALAFNATGANGGTSVPTPAIVRGQFFEDNCPLMGAHVKCPGGGPVSFAWGWGVSALSRTGTGTYNVTPGAAAASDDRVVITATLANTSGFIRAIMNSGVINVTILSTAAAAMDADFFLTLYESPT